VSFAPPLPAATQTRILWPFAIVTLIWGSTWLVIRGQLGDVPPSWSVCYRFALAAAAMFGLAIVRRVPLRLGLRDHLLLAAMGVAIFGLNFNLVYRAEAHVTSGLVAVTFALLVVYNSILARLFLHQRLSRPFLLGSGVAMAGVALLFAHELRFAPQGPREVAWGIGLTLAAMLFASAANVMQGGARAKAMPMPALLGWGMLYGALADAGWAWATVGPPAFDTAPAYVAGLLYLGLVASAFAFLLYFSMIRRIGPARAGYVNVLTPVIAMGLSTVFEGYRWSLEAAAGGLLVLAGLVVAMRARSPAR